MPQDLSASELLTHSTVRIECELQNKDTSTGTGFFYHVENGDRLIPVIITNKHVCGRGIDTWKIASQYS